MSEGPWILVESEDSDWYMIPVTRRDDWYNWYSFGEDEDGNYLDMPEWAHPSPGGPSWFIIDAWHMEGEERAE